MLLKRILPVAEIWLIVILASVPLFASFPYRLNIFLSWEGAYRMYLVLGYSGHLLQDFRAANDHTGEGPGVY